MHSLEQGYQTDKQQSMLMNAVHAVLIHNLSHQSLTGLTSPASFMALSGASVLGWGAAACGSSCFSSAAEAAAGCSFSNACLMRATSSAFTPCAQAAVYCTECELKRTQEGACMHGHKTRFLEWEEACPPYLVSPCSWRWTAIPPPCTSPKVFPPLSPIFTSYSIEKKIENNTV